MKISEVTLDKIKDARARIRDKVNKTPCIYSLTLSRILQKEVFLKLENLQLTQAFKARGNANKMSLLTQDEKNRDKRRKKCLVKTFLSKEKIKLDLLS